MFITKFENWQKKFYSNNLENCTFFNRAFRADRARVRGRVRAVVRHFRRRWGLCTTGGGGGGSPLIGPDPETNAAAQPLPHPCDVTLELLPPKNVVTICAPSLLQTEFRINKKKKKHFFLEKLNRKKLFMH